MRICRGSITFGIHGFLLAIRYAANLVRETGTTLRTAAGKNLAAVTGSHTLTESVLAGTLALLRLIGTLHRRDTSFKFLRVLPHEWMCAAK